MGYKTKKRKTKINHTSKDGVHQFGEKRRNGSSSDFLLGSAD